MSYGRGWRFKTDYHDLKKPLGRGLFAEALAVLARHDYAFNSNGTVKQGYFLRFDETGLRAITGQIVDEPLPVWLAEIVGDPTIKNAHAPPTRKEVLLQQMQRDRAVVWKLKELYDNVCMMCGKIIVLPDGRRFSEAHHIRPLGHFDDVDDTMENLLCVCPNCHAELDYGCRPIDLDSFAVPLLHSVSPANIDYHNRHIYSKPVTV
jgi:hypothetical protein